MIKKFQNKKIFDLPIILVVVIFVLCFDMIVKISDIFEISSLYKAILKAIELFLFSLIIIPGFIEKPYINKNKLIFIGLIILSGISTYLSHDSSLLFTLLLCWSIRNEDIKRVLKFIFICSLSIILIEIVYYFIAKYILIIEIDEYSRYNRIRYAFGVGHPNTFSLYIFNLSMIYLYVNDGNVGIKKYVLTILITISSYLLAVTRTTFILALFVIALFYLASFRNNIINNYICWFSRISFIIVGLCFIGSIFAYEKGYYIGKLVDKFLSNRINLSLLAFNNCGISVFGKYIDYSEVLNGDYFFIDSIYPYLICQYGFVWIFILPVLLYIASKRGSVFDSIFIIAFCIYGIGEHIGMNFAYLCSLLSLRLIFKDK